MLTRKIARTRVTLLAPIAWATVAWITGVAWVAAIGLVDAASAASGVDRCLAVASAPGPKFASFAKLPPLPALVQARVAPAAGLSTSEARITFVGHSTFLIESSEGVKVATDYNDYVRPAALPDIATMNRAHATHFTDQPSPMIKHVLRGWNPDGGPANHDIEYKDVHVRNVPTNTRWGDTGSFGAYGNSIFIFQMAP
jgi:Beta-lactamase superfamily domain